jgi:UDP-N-acetylmuramate: L-alanyl-gamma-D-glutamyl-meso-diaminopimelate ligase
MKEKNKSAYLIGICGAGMSALAVLLKEAGYKVTGSDEGFY